MMMMRAIRAGWEAVIGIEVHAQLAASRKLFSASSSPSSVGLQSAPNSHVSLHDAAFPGTLPVLQPECVEKAVLVGLALGGTVNLRSSFDRKHYFYADLPAGFQITQHRQPLVTGGNVCLDHTDGLSKQCTVRLMQIQLEQDSGKSLLDQRPGVVLVDLNRAGSALVEIVSQPDLRSSIEAAAYVRRLQSTLRAIGASLANLEDGTMRCDVNVSVRRAEPDAAFGTRIELKNLNSVRSLSLAIDYEIDEQIHTITTGRQVLQQTKSFNVSTGKTFVLRDKEQARDYRYMPEPDLPDIVLDPTWVEKLGRGLPELPNVRSMRLASQYDLAIDRVRTLMDEPGAADFFEQVMHHVTLPSKQSAPVVFNWVMSELLGHLRPTNVGLTQSPVSPQQIASIVIAVQDNTISGKQAKAVLGKMMNGASDLAQGIAEAQGWRITENSAELQTIVDQLVHEHPDKVAAIRGGKDRILGWFVAQVLKSTHNQAKPDVVARLLRERMMLPPK